MSPASPGGPAGGAAPSSPAAAGHVRKPRDVALIGFVGVVAAVVVGSLVALAVVRGSADGPADVARAYLQALADAHAAKALTYTSNVPVEQSLLTDAVLADARQRAPLTGIQVEADPGAKDAVEVHYRLGDQSVDDHYTLSRVSGAWKLDRASVPVDFMPLVGTRLPVVVNGTTVTQQATSAFPVSYAVTTGLPDVDWGGDSTTTVVLQRPGRGLKLQARLTRGGQDAFVAGAKRVVGTCAAKHALAPEGCPFGFRQPTRGPRIPDSTVRWKVQGNPWAGLDRPEVDSLAAPGTVRARTQLTVTCTCRFSTGEACKPQDVTGPVVFAAELTKHPLDVQISPY